MPPQCIFLNGSSGRPWNLLTRALFCSHCSIKRLKTAFAIKKSASSNHFGCSFHTFRMFQLRNLHSAASDTFSGRPKGSSETITQNSLFKNFIMTLICFLFWPFVWLESPELNHRNCWMRISFAILNFRLVNLKVCVDLEISLKERPLCTFS